MKIIEDKRPIKALFMNDESYFQVGKFGFTKIEPYEESGEKSNVTWFKIFSGEVISCRANSNYVSEILYQ